MIIEVKDNPLLLREVSYFVRPLHVCSFISFKLNV